MPAASWHIVFHDTSVIPNARAPASSRDLPASAKERWFRVAYSSRVNLNFCGMWIHIAAVCIGGLRVLYAMSNAWECIFKVIIHFVIWLKFRYMSHNGPYGPNNAIYLKSGR